MRKSYLNSKLILQKTLIFVKAERHLRVTLLFRALDWQEQSKALESKLDGVGEKEADGYGVFQSELGKAKAGIQKPEEHEEEENGLDQKNQ